MLNLIKQSTLVLSINLNSFRNRKGILVATISSVAFVIIIFMIFFSVAVCFEQTLKNSGSENVAIILSQGAISENTSIIDLHQAKLIDLMSRKKLGKLFENISKENYTVINASTNEFNSSTNIVLRGIGINGIKIRGGAKLISGRMFREGANEVIIGASLSNKFEELKPNNFIRLGKHQWKIVGIFSTDNKISESELWTDIYSLQNFFHKEGFFQSIRIKTSSLHTIKKLESYLKKDLKFKLNIKSEKDFYKEQSSIMINLIYYLGWPLIALLTFGSLIGIANTMYSSILIRKKEIMILQIMGCKKAVIFISTMLESLLMSGLGSVIGIMVSFCIINNMTTSILGSHMTQLIFDIKMSHYIVEKSIFLSIFIGIIGGFFPAMLAAKIKMTHYSRV